MLNEAILVHNSTTSAVGLVDKTLAVNFQLTTAVQVTVTINHLPDRAALDADVVMLKEPFQ
jgi:hypothetical protein